MHENCSLGAWIGHTLPMRGLTIVAILLAMTGSLQADVSKLSKEIRGPLLRQPVPGRGKVTGGYPLAEDRGFGLRFYWIAMQDKYDQEFDEVDLYTRDGYFLGTYPERFVSSLRMEGSGWLADGRVINYNGRCRYGVGTCYETLDPHTHPYGRGAGQQPLIPFKSVAVDPALIPIGEPLYIPEFDGLFLPDGSIHDGCVRADDTGGNIKKREMDFFVVSYDNFRFLLSELWGVIWITPYIEAPRCEYMRQD